MMSRNTCNPTSKGKGKSRGKVHHRTGHEGPEGEQRYNYSFFNLGARWGGWPTPRPGRFTPGGRPGTHCIGGWVSPRACLDRCGKSRPPTGIPSPDRQARSDSLYRLRYPGPGIQVVTLRTVEGQTADQATATETLQRLLSNNFFV